MRRGAKSTSSAPSAGCARTSTSFRQPTSPPLMLRRLLTLLVLLIAAAPALAQPRQNAIRPELVAEGPAVPGGEVELAIVMHTKPGWHGYWLNPGDAGLPMTIDWQLPPGASLGPLRFPVPNKLLVAGIVNYVYERDHAVL